MFSCVIVGLARTPYRLFEYIDSAIERVERDLIISFPREGGEPRSNVDLQRNLGPRLRGEGNDFNMFYSRINRMHRETSTRQP